MNRVAEKKTTTNAEMYQPAKLWLCSIIVRSKKMDKMTKAIKAGYNSSMRYKMMGIMLFNPNKTPLLGYWENETFWKRLKTFIRKGKWPKPIYIKGMLDHSERVHVTIDNKTGRIIRAEGEAPPKE